MLRKFQVKVHVNKKDESNFCLDKYEKNLKCRMDWIRVALDNLEAVSSLYTPNSA